MLVGSDFFRVDFEFKFESESKFQGTALRCSLSLIHIIMQGPKSFCVDVLDEHLGPAVRQTRAPFIIPA